MVVLCCMRISRFLGEVFEQLRNKQLRYTRVEKGTSVGVVYRARGPALGSWEDRPPAAYVCVRAVARHHRPPLPHPHSIVTHIFNIVKYFVYSC
eukprot:1176011-Prorocentrum_minimum.AAC.8